MGVPECIGHTNSGSRDTQPGFLFVVVVVVISVANNSTINIGRGRAILGDLRVRAGWTELQGD